MLVLQWGCTLIKCWTQQPACTGVPSHIPCVAVRFHSSKVQALLSILVFVFLFKTDKILLLWGICLCAVCQHLHP